MDRGTAELQTNDEQLVNIETEQASIDNAVCTFLLENNRLKAADLKRAESYREQHGGDLVSRPSDIHHDAIVVQLETAEVTSTT